MEIKTYKTFLETKLFWWTFEKIRKNTDIDAVTFDADKKKFYEMKKRDQDKVIAGRKISEILKRFDNKIKDPRPFVDGKRIVKIIKSFLKIN